MLGISSVVQLISIWKLLGVLIAIDRNSCELGWLQENNRTRAATLSLET